LAAGRWNANCTVLGNMNRKSPLCTLNLSAPEPPLRGQTAPPRSPAGKRLAHGFAYMEKLDRERAQGHNPLFGTLMEWLIVWRELVELELHAVDEQMGQISSAESKDSD